MFLSLLRDEFKDARRRFEEIHYRISELVTPPSDFLFDQATRDRLLFEVEGDFVYTRRYFWAYQSLALMNEEIQALLVAYRSTFIDNVWDGSDKIFWPSNTDSKQHAKWKARAAYIKTDIEKLLVQLEKLEHLNRNRMREIDGLRDNIFSGTSAYQQAVAVMQGNNIKLLTIVTIFFLPLSFVTSVFGMTNMVSTSNFTHFAITTVSIYVPTYALIGSLSTSRGFVFWTKSIGRLKGREIWRNRNLSVLETCRRLCASPKTFVKWSFKKAKLGVHDRDLP